MTANEGRLLEKGFVMEDMFRVAILILLVYVLLRILEKR